MQHPKTIFTSQIRSEMVFPVSISISIYSVICFIFLYRSNLQVCQICYDRKTYCCFETEEFCTVLPVSGSSSSLISEACPV